MRHSGVAANICGKRRNQAEEQLRRRRVRFYSGPPLPVTRSMASASKQEDDASELRFGPDFQNSHCLTNGEVALILEQQLGSSEQKGIQPKKCARAKHSAPLDV